ncbi:hypothetical protein CRUP_008754 [Coryphaenoides rupestris]|nr:hypothetical protein CRUP_008754 [Coryphaenoides rupestris]
MDSADGNWEDPALPTAIISKYLRHPGNSLGTAELNSIGGDNLCFLDVSLLGNISESSIRNIVANALTLTNCTIEKKRTLFSIAEAAFSGRTRADTITTSNFQLLQRYLSGADKSYVGRLAKSSVNMDLDTFTNLDPGVVADLSVAQVAGLLGTNIRDLKAYENQSLVQSWIRSQLQSELDGLGVEITGGRATPAVTMTTVAPGSGSTAGGDTTGGATPGGATPGGATPGGVTPGGVTPGGVTPGGVTPGGVTPGGVTPGGVVPTTTTNHHHRPNSLCLLTLLILIFTVSQHGLQPPHCCRQLQALLAVLLGKLLAPRAVVIAPKPRHLQRQGLACLVQSAQLLPQQVQLGVEEAGARGYDDGAPPRLDRRGAVVVVVAGARVLQEEAQEVGQGDELVVGELDAEVFP